jgi:phosphoribosylanthranilate isomerase
VDLPRGPVVKICGLTCLEDVVAARDLGVWALGFVFAPSPRRLTPAAARGLVEAVGLGQGGTGRPGRAAARAESPADRRAGERLAGADDGHSGDGRVRGPLVVGVFVDATGEQIARIVEEVGLDAVQLHGMRGPGAAEVRAAVAGRGREVLVIQALPVDREAGDATVLRQAIAGAREDADIVLLDTRPSA